MSAANPEMDTDVFKKFIKYDAERFLRNARVYRIYEGTMQILKLQIAKHMLREFHCSVMG